MDAAPQSHTRLAWLIVTGMILWTSHRSALAQSFPYVAYVSRADATARSGPGQEYYPTQKLTAGYAVEVYRHDGDQWCAVRPPQESFSWVAARALRILDATTAEVLVDKTEARVGSNYEKNSSAVQVLLSAGEVVQIAAPPASDDRWVRIAPPAGEFRWISAGDLRRDPPVETASTADGQSLRGIASPNARWRAPEVARRGQPAASSDPFAHLIASTTPADSTSATLVSHNASPAASAPTDGPGDDIVIVTGSPAEREHAATPPAGSAPNAEVVKVTPPPASSAPNPTAQGSATPITTTPTTTTPTTTTPGSAPPRIKFPGESIALPVNDRIAELRLHLSRVVAEQPRSWDLTGIRTETAALLAQEQDASAREQYRDLLDRVSVFQQVQERYMNPPTATLASINSNAIGDANANELAGDVPGDRQFTGETDAIRARIARDVSSGTISAVRDLDPGAVMASARGSESGEVDPFEQGDVKYDAVGTLKPVVSKRSGAPRYALVDDDGDVAAFVTATPDLNLSQFVGKRIGVNGQRGFMPDYRRSHVTATRVRTIDETVRR